MSALTVTLSGRASRAINAWRIDRLHKLSANLGLDYSLMSSHERQCVDELNTLGLRAGLAAVVFVSALIVGLLGCAK